MDISTLNNAIDLTMKMSDNAFKLFGAGDLTSDYKRITNELLLIRVRLNKPELYILVGGEVKVGKSTFINCLLGKDVCFSDDEVCTNVPSMIRYGEKEKALVHFMSDAEGRIPASKEISFDDIPKYSTESRNKRNKEAVDYIEIFINCPILETGLVFIDTPGLGALDPRHAVATFNIASQADVILFLGNTDKELSSFEVASLKRLIECSRCGFVSHILTCCDRGDAEVICTQNTKTLEVAFPEMKVHTIRISSMIYKKYLQNKKEVYLKKSGYEEVFSFINKISDMQKDILCEICSKELFVKIDELIGKINVIKESAENPIKLEQRLKELNKYKERLEELSKNNVKWKNSFEEKQIELQSEINQYVVESERRIFIDVDELVEDDTYLNSKEMLTSAIQTKLIVFKNDLNSKIHNRMLDIYILIKKETGLTKIQEDIHTVKGVDVSQLKLPKNCGEIPKFTTLKNHVGNVMLGGAVAHYLGVLGTQLGFPAVSAKIGAMIGSVAPGIGNLIGAAGGYILGGLIGLTMSIFQTKDSKRKKVAADCKRQLSSFFSGVKNKVVSALSENKFMLSSQFLKELSDERRYCEKKIKELQPMAAVARYNMDSVCAILETLNKIKTILSSK